MNTAKRIARRWLQRTRFGYRWLLKREHNVSGPHGAPDAPWENAVLKTQDQVEAAVEQIRELGLPLMSDRTKNWDSLAALDLILRTTNRDACIFDAGGERYSMILPWLFLYGYDNLVAGNVVFSEQTRRGPIVYEHADITNTDYSAERFDAITCLSVVEHGVDLEACFEELSRILKPGGVLVVSTDYYETPVDTRGQTAYGVPIHIFTRDEIIEALNVARTYDLVPTTPIDLTAEEKVVHWERFDLRYTFVVFSLRKET